MEISYDLAKERINIVFFKKYVDNNNDLTSRLLKTFFWKNLLLMKVTPILDQAVFNIPQNVGERVNIHAKILKNPVPHLLSVEEKGGDIHQWRTQEFFSVGGVQQIQLRKEDRENRDLEAVAP